MVAHFYHIPQEREFRPPSVVIHEAHVPVDLHLESLKLVYDVEEDETLAHDALSPNTTVDRDYLIVRVRLMEGLHEFRHRHSLVFMFQTRMSF